MARLVRLPEVLERTGIKRATAYAWARQRKFPAPIKIGARASAWHLDEIDQWIRERTKASRPESAVT